MDRGNSRGERRRTTVGLKKDGSKKSLKNKFRSSAVIADESNADLAEIEEDLRNKKPTDKPEQVPQKPLDDGDEDAREKDIDDIIK
jgi:hypothetical protein